ncbi:metal-dependent transcriptional regulator [Sanguibacter sp. HDW7]|uniref:metal-dependent transcriptional regulator n=1 Tax=Sanguibacter sp. HDW7 TaxID=2714931 RepID=UPI0014082A74|nr:metal-dependent transcriptional regulator [Sanguibacter sp. HDW7]QIK83830.1 metal-dependent transcriptional regulator [Sanguibacter sp. HDW7]
MAARDSDITPVVEDYLKVVWSAGEWAETRVTTKLLAERLGVGPSTVSENVRRMVGLGLLDHEPYGAISLTAEGERLAVAMVRRHRLIETYLVERLGYAWDEVHDEAEVLEHAVSDLMLARIDAALGHPTRDPHGDPIPTVDGELPASDACTLADLASGVTGVVVRISDADPELLRWFTELGLGLDARVEVVALREFAGTVTVAWTRPDGTTSEASLGLPAARSVWVAEG